MPVADLFPMLADDELKDLAADITERGLLQPIVLDAEGRILDGRNRYTACTIAGVEPEFVTYDGDDPDGYALAVNIARRHLVAGQRAMVIARAAVISEKSQRAIAEEHGLSQSRVAYAATVLEFAPDLADSVVAGGLTLNKAYEQARDRKKAAEDRDLQLLRLRLDAPDLAEQVTEERLTLAEAIGAHRAREAERESERRAATSNLRSVLTYLTSSVLKPDALAGDYADVLDQFDPTASRREPAMALYRVADCGS